MSREAYELIGSIASSMGLEEGEDPLDFLIDNVTEVTARLVLVLQVLLDATRQDETTSML